MNVRVEIETQFKQPPKGAINDWRHLPTSWGSLIPA